MITAEVDDKLFAVDGVIDWGTRNLQKTWLVPLSFDDRWVYLVIRGIPRVNHVYSAIANDPEWGKCVNFDDVAFEDYEAEAEYMNNFVFDLACATKRCKVNYNAPEDTKTRNRRIVPKTYCP